MIIKSLSRKAKGIFAGEGKKGGSPFAKLVRYMNRGLEDGEGRAVLWNNFYGGERTLEAEIIAAFEENAALLRERRNGNVLYHEILSFSAGHTARGDELYRMVADIGQEYLRERAADQLAYGVVHLDTDHIHLHLMLSANPAGRSERTRLSKSAFGEIQKRVERFALDRYQDLRQTPIYDRSRPRERMKTDVHEQAMKVRTGKPSRKEEFKAKMHHMLERAASFAELSDLAKVEGIAFYQRGKSVGVVVKGPDGQERKHRLSTLGVQEHYEATNRRLSELAQERPAAPPSRGSGAEPPAVPAPKDPDGFARPPAPLEREIEELLGGKDIGGRDKSGQEHETERRERELRETLGKAQRRDRGERER
jgi:hypothetical protein